MPSNNKPRILFADDHLELYLLGVGLFLLFTTIGYLSIPSLSYQHWDSLENAYMVETESLLLQFGNHPLGHIIQALFFRFANYFGYVEKALPLLQLCNVVITGAAIAFYFVTLTQRLGLGITQASGWAAFLGSGYSLLFFAGSAEIYPISLLLLVLAWDRVLAAFDRRDKYSAVVAGILSGFAGLAHQFNFILLGVWMIVAFLCRTRSAVALMIASSMFTLIAGYGLLGYIVNDTIAPASLLDWIKGYGGSPTFGHSISIDGLHQVIGSGIRSHAGFTTDSSLDWVRSLIIAVIAVIAVSAMFRNAPKCSCGRIIRLSCIGSCLVGVSLIYWWDPSIEGKFWLLILPFFTALLAAGMPKMRWARWIPALLAAGLLLVNQIGGLRYQHQPDLMFERNLQVWLDHSSKDDVLYESNLLTAHLLYWGDRPGTTSAHLLIYDNEESANPYLPLEKVFRDAWARGSSVLIAEGLNEYYSDNRLAQVGASRAGINAFLNSFSRTGPVFEYRDKSGEVLRRVFRIFPDTPEAGLRESTED